MRKALIIGIDDYLDPLEPLNCCVNDAVELSKLLERHADGTANFEVKLVRNIPKKSDLIGLIKELFSGKVDVALLYFAGHGILTDLGGFIATPDYVEHDEGVSMDAVLKLANESKTRDKVIILDCCSSGAFGSPAISGGETTAIKSGMTVLTATRADQKAVEINGHGLFTELLLSALKGGAANLKGEISPGSVYAYIDQALGDWHPRPVFKTNVERFTSLRTVKPPVPFDALRKIVDYFPKPEKEFALDPSYEFTNSPNVPHDVLEPYAKKENVATFKDLQKFQSVGLVIPVDAEHMYFAAMKSKSCKLTPLGHHYWRLVSEKRF